MTISYYIWALDEYGNPEHLIDNFAHIELVKNIRRVNYFTIHLPPQPTGIIKADRRIEIWRYETGFAPILELSGFVRKFVQREYVEGVSESRVGGSGAVTTVSVSGQSAENLLLRRIVAYYANTVQTKKTGPVDNIMKEIVTENLGPLAISARDYTATTLFSIQASIGKGPVITARFAWDNVYDALVDLSNTSQKMGNEVFFDVVPVDKGFEFRTFVGKRGKDRRLGRSPMPVLFGVNYGNLTEAVMTWNYSDEVNYVYAGGQGVEENRNLQEASYDFSIARSIWSRIEGFQDARDKEDDASVLYAAYEMLAETRPMGVLTGRLLSKAGTLYQRHWGLGDLITVEYDHVYYDATVEAVMLTFNKEGQETIDVRLGAEEPL